MPHRDIWRGSAGGEILQGRRSKGFLSLSSDWNEIAFLFSLFDVHSEDWINESLSSRYLSVISTSMRCATFNVASVACFQLDRSRIKESSRWSRTGYCAAKQSLLAADASSSSSLQSPLLNHCSSVVFFILQRIKCQLKKTSLLKGSYNYIRHLSKRVLIKP